MKKILLLIICIAISLALVACGNSAQEDNNNDDPVKENYGTEFLGCFEEVYEESGMTYMDVYIHAECVGKGNLHTDFRRDM